MPSKNLIAEEPTSLRSEVVSTSFQQQLQQKFLQFKYFQEQMEQLSQHVQLLHQQNQSLETAKLTLQELEKTSSGTEMLAPLADGLFMKVNLQDKEKVIVNVGANVAVEKNTAAVRKQLEEQQRDLTLRIIEGEAVLEQLQQQVMKIYKEIEPHVQSG